MSPKQKRFIHLNPVRSLAVEIEHMFKRVNLKADEYCAARGSIYGYEVDDWMHAEHALIWKPDVHLKRETKAFTVEVDLQDNDVPELKVQVTENQLLVTSGLDRQGRQIFRLVTFPEPVDPATVDAETIDTSLQIVVKKLA